jgi:ParB-like chromosome segregation protein Spo0J
MRRYEIVAGARRLAALRKLAAKEGSGITKSSPIPVHVLDNENDMEASLPDNTVGVNMPIADQAEAFRKLIDEDAKSPEQVADWLGCSRRVVACTDQCVFISKNRSCKKIWPIYDYQHHKIFRRFLCFIFKFLKSPDS